MPFKQHHLPKLFSVMYDSFSRSFYCLISLANFLETEFNNFGVYELEHKILI
jgi:hypothetical protein